MVYLTMVQEAQNVVTYIINLMKVSRKFHFLKINPFVVCFWGMSHLTAFLFPFGISGLPSSG